ncbi:MAG: uncharacterized protein KVP18_002712 [Porospora cf. gigantea A]|uniref:uncharacterized protein n=1 Tax=Porospora cf. gigantea A TaxID=2853593 RepID=UPI0035598A62|nr:MAG: hypothetical protein KVP18_002712 [Porospora cf. gigantea A]
MSPELLRKEVYDEKSDVWALGCVFFELVSGRSPFFSAKTTAGLRRLVDGPAPTLSGNVSPELKTLIGKMMHPTVSHPPTIHSPLTDQRRENCWGSS